VKRLFRQVEILNHPDQRGEDPSRFGAIDFVNDFE
jgi:hypothetical protein